MQCILCYRNLRRAREMENGATSSTEEARAGQKSKLQRTFNYIRRNWRKIIEFIVLLVLVVLVWGLLSLPIAFYYISPSQVEDNNSSNNEGESRGEMDRNETNSAADIFSGDGGRGGDSNQSSSSGGGICRNAYSGKICFNELTQYTSCDSPGTRDTPYISNTMQDQMEIEETVDQLVFALDLLIQPSKECRCAVVPFLCVYFFGACGSGNDDYRPTSSQCRDVRDSVCQREWEEASALLDLQDLPQLPDCSTLPDDGLNCNQGGRRNNCSSNLCADIQCHEHFYCDNGFCIPRCDRFREYPDSYEMLSDGLIITFGCLGLICGIGVIVIFIVRRKTMMQFPVVFVLYATITQLVAEVTILITFMDRSTLYCSSINLIDSLKHSTPYCTFGGVVQSYIILQGTLWWIFNIAAIYWKVQFPFHSRYYDNSKKTRYVHLGCAVIALLVPIVSPITIAATGGFTITRFPPISCLGRDINASFYTLVLPISLLYAAGTTILLLILWKIRRHMVSGNKQSSNKVQLLSSAELKLFIVFLYYLFSGVLQLTTFSISTRHIDHDIDAAFDYFTCQRSGDDPACSVNIRQNPVWSLLAILVLLLFPAINLFFALKLTDLKRPFVFCGQYLGSGKRQQKSTSGASSSLSS